MQNYEAGFDIPQAMSSEAACSKNNSMKILCITVSGVRAVAKRAQITSNT
jgi:hypothetical protein